MTIKRHRVVTTESPFQNIIHALRDRALQCAENEGWPVLKDEIEHSFVIARSNLAQCVAGPLDQHIEEEASFRSGRTPTLRRTGPSTRRGLALVTSRAPHRSHG
jgi:hypothetical protein